MGRAFLITAAVLAVAGCSPSGAATPPAHGVAAHQALTCAACHRGGLPVTAANARVPDAACTASGCHSDGGPVEVQLGDVTFHHRQHGRTGGRVAPCAGCHVHGGNPQDRKLVATADACALCHAQQLTGRKSSDCRTCHKEPDHVPVTSQGVPIPHSALAAAQTDCLRCHYDVAAPTRAVSSRRCASCHDTATIARGVGQNLHPEHAGIACTNCHERAQHRVLAMSSAVVLDCRDCHTVAHGQRLATLGGDPSATCTACHTTTHQAEQRLVLGEVPGMPPEPAMKFTVGLTCRSCHISPATSNARGTQPVTGQAAACAGCHRPEYKKVLGWWELGTKQRESAVEAYLGRARATLGSTAPDSARKLLDWVGRTLTIVQAGGGAVHNLDLTDQIFRRSVADVRTAYRLAGREAPASPTLGNAARVGFCSYCHYSLTDPWDFQRMPAQFHRSVLDSLRVDAAESPGR